MFIENAHTMIPDFDAPTPEPLTCAQLGEVSCPVLLIVGSETLPHYKLVAAEVLAVCRTLRCQKSKVSVMGDRGKPGLTLCDGSSTLWT